jgi:tetratricopeptide (TPR) repeat protein
VTPRLRVSLLVAAIAAAAAGVTVGATLLTSGGEHAPRSSEPTLRPGVPPLLLDLGVRTDAEARALREADALYAAGKRPRARAVFGRYRSLEARVGAALADWPAGLRELEGLAREHPGSALVQLHLGLARYWTRNLTQADAAWRAAKRLAPDSLYAVRAGDLLHPGLPIPGLPEFAPSFASPPQLAQLSPPRQLAFLAARARRGGVRARLQYGVALQRLGRPISAEREFAAAASLAPDDVEAQVARDVGLFDKDRPAVAFSRLGPLARTHPRSVTVRFHLGLMLLWLGQVSQARSELRQAVSAGPRTLLGREAQAFLLRLGRVGTSPSKR